MTHKEYDCHYPTQDYEIGKKCKEFKTVKIGESITERK